MTTISLRRSILAAVLGVAAAAWAGGAGAPAAPVRLEVDAPDAPRKLFHARLRIPAAPEAMTLLDPKWLPGEHGPTGPVAELAGLDLAGLRIERDPARPDLFTRIVRPLAAAVPAAGK